MLPSISDSDHIQVEHVKGFFFLETCRLPKQLASISPNQEKMRPCPSISLYWHNPKRNGKTEKKGAILNLECRGNWNLKLLFRVKHKPFWMASKENGWNLYQAFIIVWGTLPPLISFNCLLDLSGFYRLWYIQSVIPFVFLVRMTRDIIRDGWL